MNLERATLIGVIGGLFAIFGGMVIKGAPLSTLANPAAFLIIIGGTAAALFNAFTMEKIKKFPTLVKLIFKKQELMPKLELLTLFIGLSQTARRDGLLALENQARELNDPFLRNGLIMVIDGMDVEFVKNVLHFDVDAMEERHRDGALIFSQAGMYAPTLGVLGAVVGLIAALGSLADIDKLGHAIAAAFVATLLGIFTGYVIWHPFATKLKGLSKEEAELRRMMIEGILSIQAGDSPVAVEAKLMVFVPLSERADWEKSKTTEGA